MPCDAWLGPPLLINSPLLFYSLPEPNPFGKDLCDSAVQERPVLPSGMLVRHHLEQVRVASSPSGRLSWRNTKAGLPDNAFHENKQGPSLGMGDKMSATWCDLVKEYLQEYGLVGVSEIHISALGTILPKQLQVIHSYSAPAPSQGLCVSIESPAKGTQVPNKPFVSVSAQGGWVCK